MVLILSSEKSPWFYHHCAMFEWAYSGVNASLPGNGGPECAAFLSPTRRVIETAITLAFAVICILWGYRNISVIPQICSCGQKNDTGKRVLLVITSLMWGMEIGFKCASRTVIYLLNPCHITTALQASINSLLSIFYLPFPASTCFYVTVEKEEYKDFIFLLTHFHQGVNYVLRCF